MDNRPVVSVIIPTLATAERALYLRRALESVQSQTGVTVLAIVVTNGARCCPEVLAELETRPGIQCIRLAQGGLPAALEAGRAQVKTEFFSELDDDDVLLPGSLDLRVRFLQARPDVDVVVANGQIRDNGDCAMSIPDVAAVRRDPLRALMRENWLLPGAAVFRTSTISPELFADIPMYLEWTYLALLLLSKRKVSFLGEPALVHFAGHPFSVDRSMACCLGRTQALERLLEMELSGFVKRRIEHRIADGHHQVSCLWLKKAVLRKAWAAHWRSLTSRGGWRYLTYTRHLLPRPNRPALQVPQPDNAHLD